MANKVTIVGVCIFGVLAGSACDRLAPYLPKNGAEQAAGNAVVSSDQIAKLLDEASAELEKKNYGRTVEITSRISNAAPENAEAYVIKSQANCMSGDMSAALSALEDAFKNGMKDINRLLAEPRLAAVRTSPAFQDLLRKYGFGSSALVTATEVKAGDVSIKEENGMQVITAGSVTVRVPKD